jgi:hypothetical protein
MSSDILSSHFDRGNFLYVSNTSKSSAINFKVRLHRIITIIQKINYCDLWFGHDFLRGSVRCAEWNSYMSEVCRFDNPQGAGGCEFTIVNSHQLIHLSFLK